MTTRPEAAAPGADPPEEGPAAEGGWPWLRQSVIGVVSFDRASVSVGAGLRSTLALVAVLIIGLGTGHTAGAATMGAGALVVAMAGRSGGLSAPVLTMVATTVGMGLSTFAGAATGSNEWLHLVVMAAFGFSGGMLAALGNAASLVGVQAVMAVIVFGRFPESPRGALDLAGLVMVGGAAQVVLALAVRLPPSFSRQRGALALAYRQLAGLAGGGLDAPGTPAAEALEAAERTLDSGNLFALGEMTALRGLLDEGRRIRLQILALGPQRRRQADPRVEAVLARVAAELDAVASGLSGPGPSLPHLAGPESAPTASDGRAVPAGLDPALERQLAALVGQVRAVVSLGREAAEPVRLGDVHLATRSSGLPRALQVLGSDLGMLRANLSGRSSSCRHAIRLGLVVPLAALLADHLPLQRGYWITLTVAVVLKPDFSATLTRGAARTTGTVVGVTVAGLVAASIHPDHVVSLVFIAVLASGGFAVWQANYAAGVGFVTALIVFLLDLVTPDTMGTVGNRLAGTLLGGAIALGAYGLWPTWSDDEARAALGSLIGALAGYLRAVLACLGRPDADGTGSGAEDLAGAGRRARLARANAESAVGRSLAEPTRRRIDAGSARGALAGLRRVAQAIHGMRLDLEAGERPTGAELEATLELGGQLNDALVALAATVVDGRARDLPPLRAAHQRLAAFGTDRALAIQTDELVDAIDTVGHLFAMEPEATNGPEPEATNGPEPEAASGPEPTSGPGPEGAGPEATNGPTSSPAHEGR